MNPFIKSQIANMQLYVKTFENGCKIAATKDDGAMSREEAKVLKELEKANSKYIKELEKIITNF